MGSASAPVLSECDPMFQVNKAWNAVYGACAGSRKPISPKVQFSIMDPEVFIESVDLADDYQACRKGPWEQYALDRCRFRSVYERVRNVLIAHIICKLKVKFDNFFNFNFNFNFLS